MHLDRCWGSEGQQGSGESTQDYTLVRQDMALVFLPPGLDHLLAVLLSPAVYYCVIIFNPVTHPPCTTALMSSSLTHSIQCLRTQPTHSLPLPPLPCCPLPGADIQETIGSAIALAILSGGRLPLWAGCIIISVTAFLLLLLDRVGFRQLEAVFAVFIGVEAVALGMNFFQVSARSSGLLRCNKGLKACWGVTGDWRRCMTASRLSRLA